MDVIFRFSKLKKNYQVRRLCHWNSSLAGPAHEHTDHVGYAVCNWCRKKLNLYTHCMRAMRPNNECQNQSGFYRATLRGILYGHVSQAVLYRNDWTNRVGFLARMLPSTCTYPTLCCKLIWVYPKLRVRPLFCSKQRTQKISPWQVDRVVNKTRRRRQSSLLTTPIRQSTRVVAIYQEFAKCNCLRRKLHYIDLLWICRIVVSTANPQQIEIMEFGPTPSLRFVVALLQGPTTCFYSVDKISTDSASRLWQQKFLQIKPRVLRSLVEAIPWLSCYVTVDVNKCIFRLFYRPHNVMYVGLYSEFRHLKLQC